MTNTVTKIGILGILTIVCSFIILSQVGGPHVVNNEKLGQLESLKLVPAKAVAVLMHVNQDSSSTSTILRRLDLPIQTYIKLLHKSVKVVEVPFATTPTVDQATRDCSSQQKQTFINGQHSLEVRFPLALRLMQSVGVDKKLGDLQLLWLNSTSDHVEPLFYFLQSFQYYVVHCSYNSRGKESWDKGVQYLAELSNYVVKQSPEFQRNLGVDFLVPASHPKSGPFGVKTHIISAYQRQTFLRTDLDFNGNTPRDIIVPYYVPRRSGQHNNSIAGIKDITHLHSQKPTDTTGAITNDPRKLLLFFAGGKNPPGGLREQLEAQFAKLQKEDGSVASDVLFTTRRIASSVYEWGLHSGAFCAHVRGDTASSSRLFQMIEAGCIPVLISDWLLLPFESIIDYSKFTLRFPESIVHDVRLMVAHLRSIPQRQVVAMKQALREARGMLLFPPLQQIDNSAAVGELHVLNPVTLTLVEMFIRRKQYCDALSLSKQRESEAGRSGSHLRSPAQEEDLRVAGGGRRSNMCSKLYARLSSVSRLSSN
jgi:hypothetical protein